MPFDPIAVLGTAALAKWGPDIVNWAREALNEALRAAPVGCPPGDALLI